MIVPDINLLVYAHDNNAPKHAAAQSWWESLINGTEPVGLPWLVIVGFIRLITNPRVVTPPATPAQAVGYVQDWLACSHIQLLNPGPAHLELLRQNLDAAGAGGNLVPDAHIAALAMEYDAEAHTGDADFGRFPGVRWRNPL